MSVTEVLTGAEAADLPDGSVVACDRSMREGTPSRPREKHDGVWHGGEDPSWFPDLQYRVLHRAPEPLRAGSVISGKRANEELPDGSVVRLVEPGRVRWPAVKVKGRWLYHEFDRVPDLLVDGFGFRVLAIGDEA